MNYIYKGLLIKPTERELEDGRDLLDAAISKIHSAGPKRPEPLCETVERLTVANRKSVQTIKKALRRPHGIGRTAHLEVNLDALRKSSNPKYNYTIRDGRVVHRELRKVATSAKPPQSSNGQWDDTHANTGASNDWHDQIAPSVKPTRITFPQFGTPGQIGGRDAAVEAIKQDLSKPKRMGASPNVDDALNRGQ